MATARPRRLGRIVLGGLAIASAIGFLTLLMVQAMAFYAPPKEAPKKPLQQLIGPATKAGPVLRPPPLVDPEERRRPLDLFPATKSGTLGPLRLSR